MSSKTSKKNQKQLPQLNKQNYTQKYENALDPSYYIMAQMKNGNWFKAKIIDCRLPISKNLEKNKIQNENQYEYYVHYIEFNRRMDEWISRDRICPLEELLEVEPVITKKRKGDEKREENDYDEHAGMDEASLLEHEEATKFKTIDSIQIGKYKCETWYYSPYPEGYYNIECLYHCEFCLSFYTTINELNRHTDQCPLTHPPGDEIYRYEQLSVFEVDGRKNQTYCENLCYLAKLFLDHKLLYYDVERFLFYVLCEHDEFGYYNIVGYFSKLKDTQLGWNLSCILTLPFHQRKGYGKFLITFSYELSIIEGKIGTPERPLSDLGRESYFSWWTQRIIEFIKHNQTRTYSIQNISQETGIKQTDILATLERGNLIKYYNGQYCICTDLSVLNNLYQSAGKPGIPVYREYIHWVPHIKI